MNIKINNYQAPKPTKRQRAIKFALIQLALIIALLATQIALIFFHDYRIFVIEKKDGSWIDIAESAEGSLSLCQSQLAQTQADKDAAIMAANPDLDK